MIANQYRNLCVGMYNTSMIGGPDVESDTNMVIINLNQAELLAPADSVSGIGGYTPSAHVSIRNLQLDNMSSGLTFDQVSADPWAGSLARGTKDFSGAVPANTWMGMFIVGNGGPSDPTQPGFNPDNLYCIWSQSFNTPALGSLPGSPTYCCLIQSNYTNALGTGWAYRLIKVNRRTYFVGRQAPVNQLPLICSGVAGQWTNQSLNAFVPPTGGPLGVSLRATVYSGQSGIVAVAPNNCWSGVPPLYLNLSGSPFEDASIEGEIQPDQGNYIAFWSQLSSAWLYASYFDDTQ